MEFLCEFGEPTGKPFCAKIANGDDEGRIAYEVFEADALIRLRTKDIVRVAGKTVSDAVKASDPPRGARSQTGEMYMKVRYAVASESAAEICSFPETAFVADVARTGPEIFQSRRNQLGFELETETVRVRKIIDRNIIERDVCRRRFDRSPY
jgi:hypothetical protein